MRNNFERSLDLQLKRHKVKYTYEKVKIPYIISGLYYLPDFVLENGIIIEAKGYLDTETKRKMISVKKCNPDLDIRFVFYDAHKKISRTKQTHAQWAEKNGFGWADRNIPEDWLKGI